MCYAHVMCTCVYVMCYAHTHVHVGMCACVHVCMCACVHACVHVCMCKPGRSTLCGKWFLNERISRSSEPCSSPLTHTHTHTHRDATATAKSAVGPGHAKRGATCSYKNGMQFCTPQFSKQL